MAQGCATFCPGVSITCQGHTSLGVTPTSCWDSVGCGLTLIGTISTGANGNIATLGICSAPTPVSKALPTPFLTPVTAVPGSQ